MNKSGISQISIDNILEKRLVALQNTMIEKKISMLILFEGNDEDAKGSFINKLIKPLDQRWLNVYSIDDLADMYKNYPYLKRFWVASPTVGKISIVDKMWFRDEILANGKDEISNDYYERIVRFENQLESEGIILIKFILPSIKVNNLMIPSEPSWTILNEKTQELNDRKMFEVVIKRLEEGLAEPTNTLKQIVSDYLPKFSFDTIDLSLNLEKEIFEKRLETYHQEMKKLPERLLKSKKSIILLFEGWDGAGKSGSIGSLISPLDPRKYKVVPHATIKDFEQGRHYLYYYWNLVPKFGDILIMDRTWYKWVMENRIYNKCYEEKWNKAYTDICDMEKELADSGVIILKFWLHIDQDEQLIRFKHRMDHDSNVKENQLEDDWKNRAHWRDFEKCAEEMIDRTSKPHAPWIVVESTSSAYAKDKIFTKIFNVLNDGN
ncbi:hypothetical protein [Neobacillus niacini]|uniref:hypothetical protein n=1 Tax=Neobacillus niacini TaxID=86668 RepID=UPI00203FE4E2|nr:hypothetical protein [Neobacillus niacini]MCM3691446.1 hypothetical protein [Neobacillus niacini]